VLELISGYIIAKRKNFKIIHEVLMMNTNNGSAYNYLNYLIFQLIHYRQTIISVISTDLLSNIH